MSVEDLSDDDAAQPERPRPPVGLRPWLEWFGPWRLIGAAVALVAVVAGGWWLLRPPAPPTEAGLPLASAPTSTAPAAPAGPAPGTTVATGPILVHVAGAVVQPGVYELEAAARVHTAIDAAGGPLPEADPGSLNLAAGLADGERIYVPAVGESVPVAPAGSAGSSADPAATGGPLDLNRATATELDELPGIGPATATAIVDHRTEHGPFASVEDLEAVRGIGPAKLDAIRNLVVL